MSTPLQQPDAELREWMDQWQADPGPSAEVREAIRGRVKRQGLRMTLYTIAETAFGLFMLAFVIRSASVRTDLFHAVAMGGLALLILWAVAYSLWSLRGTWRPSAETTSAFLSLSILRCRRRLGALRAGWWLLSLELAILIPWLYMSLNAGPMAYGFLALVTGLVAIFLVGGKQRTLRELRELEELRGALDGEG